MRVVRPSTLVGIAIGGIIKHKKYDRHLIAVQLNMSYAALNSRLSGRTNFKEQELHFLIRLFDITPHKYMTLVGKVTALSMTKGYRLDSDINIVEDAFVGKKQYTSDKNKIISEFRKHLGEINNV